MSSARTSLYWRIGLVAIITLLSSEPAWAEDEVRIQLLRRQAEVEVGGQNLSIYDGETGRRVITLRGKSSARLHVGKDGHIIAKAASGATPVKRSKLFVEAKHAIEVDRGVYYGRLEVQKASGIGLDVYNRLPLETYLLGVLGSEMSPSWPLEALKAQAIASRTYALQRIMTARAANRPFDLKDSVLSQVYNGAADISPRVRSAVSLTRGEVLVFDRRLAEALFHSTCGGRTASSRTLFGGERPYLVERRCKWCRKSEFANWKTTISLARVSELLGKANRVDGRVSEVQHSERENWVEYRDTKGRSRMPIKAFREPIPWKVLPSDHFRAETRGRTIHFSGHGFGHRVGMCQWGAKGMAEEGRKYLDILGYYYPGTYVQRIY